MPNSTRQHRQVKTKPAPDAAPKPPSRDSKTGGLYLRARRTGTCPNCPTIRIVSRVLMQTGSVFPERCTSPVNQRPEVVSSASCPADFSQARKVRDLTPASVGKTAEASSVSCKPPPDSNVECAPRFSVMNAGDFPGFPLTGDSPGQSIPRAVRRSSLGTLPQTLRGSYSRAAARAGCRAAVPAARSTPPGAGWPALAGSLDAAPGSAQVPATEPAADAKPGR